MRDLRDAVDYLRERGSAPIAEFDEAWKPDGPALRKAMADAAVAIESPGRQVITSLLSRDAPAELDADAIQEERLAHLDEELRWWRRQFARTGDAAAAECMEAVHRMAVAARDKEGSLRMRVHDVNSLTSRERDPLGMEPPKPPRSVLWRA